MSDHDVVPKGEEVARLEAQQPVLRPADDPYAQDGVPLALLEFHSPSSALVNLPPTPAARYILWLIGIMFLASFTAAAVFPLNRVVSTPGRLVSSDPTVVVQPLELSIIRSIDVTMGDAVRKGQVLAHLDPTISRADFANLTAQRDSYRAIVERLTAQAEGKAFTPDTSNSAGLREAAAYEKRQEEFKAKLSQFDQEIASLQSQMQGYIASAAMYQSRARVAAEVFQMRKRLQKEQVGSRLSTLSAQSEVLDAERAQIEAQQNANASRAKLNATAAERKNYIENWKAETYSKLSEAQIHLDEVESQYKKADLRNKLILLRSPEEGVVLNVSKVSIGSVMSPGQVLMTIVPTGTALEMEAVMRGQDAGFVKLGDHALLKFTTFPYSQYGGADATVRVISADSFTDDSGKASSASAQDSGTSETSLNGYYRVRLRIDRYTLHGVPKFFHPVPGMPVTADIQVGKRTLLQYFFNRISPAATNGLREPS